LKHSNKIGKEVFKERIIMLDSTIKTLQKILKEQKRFDLAIKFENAYYEDYKIDNWNGGIGEIKFYVNSIYFFGVMKKTGG
jgi:hypothetical protein